MSLTKVLKKWRKQVSLVYNVYMVLFLQTGIKFVTIYVRSTFQEKTEFLQEHYVSSIM